MFLPVNLAHSTFQAQINTINNINTQVTANAVSSLPILGKILVNNLKVLFFCILFSFFYGAGAIFILAWNASVIGVAVGNFARNTLAIGAADIGLSGVGAYFSSYSLALLRYFIHGLPEIAAYFIGGLAGGIISIAVIRHEYKTSQFKHIILDSLDLILIAVAILIIAAVLEVFLTPLFF